MSGCPEWRSSCRLRLALASIGSNCRHFRGSHELWPDRITDCLRQDLVDSFHTVAMQVPPEYLIDRCKLLRAPRTPQRNRVATVQHPANRQGEDGFSISGCGEVLEFGDRRQILMQSGLLEL